MDKRGILKLGAFIFLISLLLNFCFASSGYFNLSSTNYSQGDFLLGNISLDFSNEPVSSQIYLRYLGNDLFRMPVYDFLDLISGTSYNCNPLDCKDRYTLQGVGSSTKTFTLANEKLMGFIFEGNDISVTDFSFSVSSNAVSSCSNQLKFDLADDSKINWINDKSLSENCGDVKSDCNNNIFPHKLIIDSVPYCEQIILPEAPSFVVKAGLERNGGIFYQGILIARVYDSNGNLVSQCDLSMPVGGISSCSIEYSNKEREKHSVCVSLKEGETRENYRLSSNVGVNKCGFRGDPLVFPDNTANYNIYLTARRFGAVGDFNFNSNVFARHNDAFLTDYVNNYLDKKYSRDCTDKCIVPIRVSGVGQSITVSNINIKYDSLSGRGFSSDKIYDLQKTDSLVNSNLVSINLSKLNASALMQSGENDLELYSGNKLLFKENLIVLSNEVNETESNETESESNHTINFSVEPLSVLINRENNFKIILDNVSEVVAYYWELNGTVIKTLVNENKYTFNESGENNLKVTIEIKELGNFSRNFKIEVFNPADKFLNELERYKNQVNIIKSQIDELPEEYQNQLTKKFNFEQWERRILEIETNSLPLVSRTDIGEDQFEILLNRIKDVDFITSISKKSNEHSYSNSEDKIKFIHLEQLFSVYFLKDFHKKAIVDWFNDNLDAKIIHTVYSINYESKNPVVFLTEFNFVVNPKREVLDNVYFVVNQEHRGLVFINEYELSTSSNEATGVKFSGLSEKKNITFAISENVGLGGLEYFFGTDLKNLQVSQIKDVDVEKSSNIWMLILSLFLIFVLFLAIYVFLQEWYKRNYERILFKKKEEVYNLIFFIRNAKNQGLSDSQMKTKLKQSRWSGEQIDYAMNKFYGKRTGMWEIPILRPFEKRKIEQEMKKRDNFR